MKDLLTGIRTPDSADLIDAKGDMHRYAKLFRPLLTMVMLTMAGAAVAGQIDNANDAYKRGDFTAALAVLRPLADAGQADAEYELGFMYYAGAGVAQDYVAAAKWYGLAADQGFAQAQHDLGIMYLDGQGVPQDYVRAHMWLNLATSQLSEKQGRAAAVEARDYVASKMTTAQIAEAQSLARQWKPSAGRSTPNLALNH